MAAKNVTVVFAVSLLKNTCIFEYWKLGRNWGCITYQVTTTFSKKTHELKHQIGIYKI